MDCLILEMTHFILNCLTLTNSWRGRGHLSNSSNHTSACEWRGLRWGHLYFGPWRSNGCKLFGLVVERRSGNFEGDWGSYHKGLAATGVRHLDLKNTTLCSQRSVTVQITISAQFVQSKNKLIQDQQDWSWLQSLVDSIWKILTFSKWSVALMPETALFMRNHSSREPPTCM